MTKKRTKKLNHNKRVEIAQHIACEAIKQLKQQHAEATNSLQADFDSLGKQIGDLFYKHLYVPVGRKMKGVPEMFTSEISFVMITGNSRLPDKFVEEFRGKYGYHPRHYDRSVFRYEFAKPQKVPGVGTLANNVYQSSVEAAEFSDEIREQASTLFERFSALSVKMCENGAIYGAMADQMHRDIYAELGKATTAQHVLDKWPEAEQIILKVMYPEEVITGEGMTVPLQALLNQTLTGFLGTTAATTAIEHQA